MSKWKQNSLFYPHALPQHPLFSNWAQMGGVFAMMQDCRVTREQYASLVFELAFEPKFREGPLKWAWGQKDAKNKP